LKSKPTIEKTYFDLEIIKKFETLEEFPITKPVLLANVHGTIIYANKYIGKSYGIERGSNIFDLFTEPNLSKLFDKLIENNISSFCTDLMVEYEDKGSATYILNLEKINIGDEEIFILYLDPPDDRKEITKKFNTFYQAVESVNVGVLIADTNANVKHISTSFENFFNIRIEKIYNQNLHSCPCPRSWRLLSDWQRFLDP